MDLVTDKLEAARQLIPNLRVVSPHLVRGGHPEPAALKALQEAGIRTIICLSGNAGLLGAAAAQRENPETVQEKSVAAKLGLNFISIPLDVFSEPPAGAIEQFLTAIGDQSNHPAFLHCLHGRDRTGLMSAVYRLTVDGWTADKAYAEMVACGFDISRTNLSDALFELAKKSSQ
jgi:protein tyrosine/serine phosphatase